MGKVGGLERESRQSGCLPLPGLQGFDCLIPKAFGVHPLSPVKSRSSMCSLGVPGRLWEPSLPPCLLLSPVHFKQNFLTCKFLSVVGILFMGTSRLLISPAYLAFCFPKATGQWLPCFCSIGVLAGLQLEQVPPKPAAEPGLASKKSSLPGMCLLMFGARFLFCKGSLMVYICHNLALLGKVVLVCRRRLVFG